MSKQPAEGARAELWAEANGHQRPDPGWVRFTNRDEDDTRVAQRTLQVQQLEFRVGVERDGARGEGKRPADRLPSGVDQLCELNAWRNVTADDAEMMKGRC